MSAGSGRRRLKILFVHQNFPGQYLHLAPALSARGHEVRALCMRQPLPQLPGVQVQAYAVKRRPLPQQHPFLVDTETKLLRAEAITAVCAQWLAQGFEPDVICAHPAWGESLYLRAVWPRARQLHFVELYYAAEGLDLGFDPEFAAVDLAARCHTVNKNLVLLQALHDMDAGICPTQWQASAVPAAYRHKLQVLHDGIDTHRARPLPGARFKATSQAGMALSLSAADQVLSFVNRNLEPSRGYHRFMRALPEILRRCPLAQVVIVGGSGNSYGAARAAGSHQQHYLDEVRPLLAASELARIHFVGRIPHAALMALFQVTRAHVYFTYPFVLSWSMLEAMACGALVIGSDTPPVRELISDGINGRLVGFFDQPALVDAACQALDRPSGPSPLGLAARQTIVERYDLARVCLPQQVAMVERLAAQGAAA